MDNKLQLRLPSIFKIVGYLRKSKKISAKMDALLHNLIDFADNNWKSKIDDAGPLTFE